MGSSISLVDNAINSDEKAILMEEKKSDRCELSDLRYGSKRGMARRERKIALLQDVDKLRKKLKHEENVHRALERAITRPFGALSHLPPYLPSQTSELLAEVAVLEEKVFKLEEQVLSFRQGLYQEAIYISSAIKTMENGVDMRYVGLSSHTAKNSEHYKTHSLLADCNPSIGSNSQLERHEGNKERLELLAPCIEDTSNKKACEEISGANKLSEEILRCLLSIFTQINLPKNIQSENEMCQSALRSSNNLKDADFQDPYSICTEFGKRDIGPYKHLHVVDFSSIDTNLISNFSFLSLRLKLLLGKLASVCISELAHQQKLAFWINIYNSCMMNAYLENGIPTTPEMVITLMSKAMVNVGGKMFSAMAIEHFILRLPYHMKQTSSPKQLKSNEMTRWSMFGLDWPEPLVTFALSCGSWSSPVVRVYTASEIEHQLEESKMDYLQAAIGVSKPSRLAIPKLLDWYLLDFAKDIESLMDWICMQLPNEVRNEAVQCLEMCRRCPTPHPIQVLPYEFRFRYLLKP